MKRLSYLVKYEVGDINDIVYRSESDSKEFLLQPLRRCCNLYTLDGGTCISWSSVCSKNFYGNCLTFSLDKCRNVRNIELAWDIVMSEICVEVASYTDVRCRIHTVCCKADFNKCICSKSKIILGRSSYDGIRIENHDTVMRLTDTKLILCADHSERLHTTNL